MADTLVTDPTLLQQLNMPGAPPSQEAVTDPALLAQLNAPDQADQEDTQWQSMSGAVSPSFSREFLRGIPILGAYIPPTPETKEMEQKHPYVSQGVKAFGAAAALAPLMAAAPEVFGVAPQFGFLTNLGAASGSGAVLGAADTYAHGGHSWKDLAEGAGEGALTSAAVPFIGKGIGTAFRGVMNLLGADNLGVLKGFDPQTLEIASKAAKDDGLTDQQIADMIKTKGPNAFLGEYGPMLKGTMQANAALPGASEGKSLITKAYEGRAAGSGDRLEQGITDMLGPRQNLATVTREAVENRANEANPLYEEFRQTRIQPTDEIKSLTDLFEKQGFTKEAKNLMLAEGKQPMTNFFTTGERKDWPTAELFDYIKQAIDDRIAPSVGKNPNKVRVLINLKGRLDNAVANSNPEAAKIWQQARETWANPTAVLNARKAGQDFWDPNVRTDESLYKLTDLSGPERAAFKEGARDALAQMMDKSVNGEAAVRRMLSAPANRVKMAMLAQNKKTNPNDFFNLLDNEAEQITNKKELAANSAAIARTKAAEALTPDPSKVPFARLLERYGYAFPVRPLEYFPVLHGLKNMQVRGQAATMEAARNELGSLLTKQGPQAQEFARALMQYDPHGMGKRGGLYTAGILRALAQPMLPKPGSNNNQ